MASESFRWQQQPAVLSWMLKVRVDNVPDAVGGTSEVPKILVC